MKQDKYKVVLVTSSQPSLNPRLVKEADALSAKGYEVVVVGQYWNSWATETDKVLLSSKPWRFIRVGGSPTEQKAIYFFTRITHKVARKLFDTVGLKYGIAEMSVGRCSIQLYKEAVNQKADLYIGHNPGGLAPAVLAAEKNNVKCGFDAEDYHRREYSDDPNHPDVLCKTYLEEKYFPRTDYITTASPLISMEYQKIFPGLQFQTILNVFPNPDISPEPAEGKGKLRLFWFSQTIGPNRGLDEVIEAMTILGDKRVELHALGNARRQAVEQYTRLAEEHKFSPGQLNFYPPIPPDDIYEFASQFDIGLATEIGLPFNRQICLTNKIFTYIQAGLAVLASDTPAQEQLMAAYPGCGTIYKRSHAESLSSAIKSYLDNPVLLWQSRKRSMKYGRERLNWEFEAVKFTTLIEQIRS